MKIKQVLLSLILCMQPLSVYANSGNAYWRGDDGSGVIVTSDDCPLIVEHETLIFDLQQFPDTRELDNYTGSVEAEYTFYNPMNYDISATLAFPIQTKRSYGQFHLEDVNITLNGEEAEKELRHTIFLNDFEVKKDMERIRNDCIQDDFYREDQIVTKYVYPKSEENLTFQKSKDERRLIFINKTGEDIKEDSITIYFPSEEEKVVYCIGKPLDEKASETMTFKEFVLMDREKEISEVDWYNARVEQLKYKEWDNHMATQMESIDWISWYVYDMDIKAKERIQNKVKAPMYPSINGFTRPYSYEYLYLVSPAKTWAEFHALDIEIHAPYYMTRSSLDYTKTEDGYEISLDELPLSELTFTLCEVENPEEVGIKVSKVLGVLAIFGAVVLGLLVLLVVLIVLLVRKLKRK